MTNWHRRLLALTTVLVGLIFAFTLVKQSASVAEDEATFVRRFTAPGRDLPLVPAEADVWTAASLDEGSRRGNGRVNAYDRPRLHETTPQERTNLFTGARAITATATATATNSVGQASNDSATITAAGNSSEVFVGAGDIAVCDDDKDELTADLLDNITGTVFTLGDNAYEEGTDSEFTNCYDPTWGRHKARTHPVPGNHDYNTPGASGYYNYFGSLAGDPDKGYYSYDVGDWHIIALNAECSAVGGCGINSAQGKWLQADLAANPSTCTLAYWHNPRFSSGFHGSAPAFQDFWELLYDEFADVVLNGHDHDYERFAAQDPSGNADPGRGIRQFVVGTGGRRLAALGTPVANSEVFNNVAHGVLKLTLHPTSYDWEFIPIAGQTFTDSGSATCVTPPNQPPVANNDLAISDEDVLVTVDVAANDTDPEGALNPASANTTCANGSTGCGGPTNGNLVNNGNGTFDYTPNINYNGPDSFVYEICDGGSPSLCDTGTVNITVNAVNDPPVANDDSAITDEDVLVTVDVAANDTDPEGALNPASANITCANGSTGCGGPTNGNLVNNGNGTFDYAPNPNYNGPDSFVYEICDGDSPSLCDTGTVNITVNAVNDPPVANSDSASTTEDTAVIINVAANDSDPDGNLDPASANGTCANGSAGCTGPSYGSLSNNFDGTIGYTPAQDYNGSDNFVYEICDGLAACDTATVTITVTALPDPPVANDDSATTSEDTPVTIDVALNDTDPDGNLNPASANTICSGGSTGCAGPTNGILSNHANGSFSYSPNPSFAGNDGFVYEICDSGSLCSTATVNITVEPVNDPPLANDDGVSTFEDSLVNIDVAANDSDVDGNLNPASTNTTCLTCSLPIHGELVNKGNGSFDYTPDSGFTGTDSFVYEICDTEGLCGTGTVTITVTRTFRVWLPIVSKRED